MTDLVVHRTPSHNSRFSMEVSFQALNHLGLNLYSNVAAVVSESVANAWDADAANVWIDVDRAEGEIRLEDDGEGMTAEEVNDHFLLIGYQRRIDQAPLTARGRKPMGRKGIGKLSLFSTANEVEVHTRKDGVTTAILMKLEDIQECIRLGERSYSPEEISPRDIRSESGTLIILRRLRRGMYDTTRVLRRRLSRRFSVLGPAYGFEVVVDGQPLTPADREYESKAQFVWTFGSRADEFRRAFSGAQEVTEVQEDGLFASGLTGWIATAWDTSQLRDDDRNSINTIVLMMRGKLAQEDILYEIGEVGVYTKYLFGEIHADYLDDDDQEDIATSSRQSLITDDHRYVEMQSFVRRVLSQIRRSWSDLRGQEGERRAIEIGPIRDWYSGLEGPSREAAKQFFGKIHRMPVDSEVERTRLLKHFVLAFESLRYGQKLAALEDISEENLHALVPLFKELDDIESSMYYQIIKERLAVIHTLRERVDESAKERAIQEHVFDHLWLLDPSWERATEPNERMEQRFDTEFGLGGEANLNDEERLARYDIKYRMSSGKHVIIELKRANRVLSFDEVIAQTGKYYRAFSKILRAAGRSEPFEIVVIVGREIAEWADAEFKDNGQRQLRTQNTQVLNYDELLNRAYEQYSDYVQSSRKASRIFELIESIDVSEALESDIVAPALPAPAAS